MLGIGTAELVVVFLVMLFVVGPRRLPQMARMIGRLVRFFKNNLSELNEAILREPSDEFRKEVADYFSSKKEGDPGDGR